MILRIQSDDATLTQIHSFIIDGDIDEIIHRGEERTAELNSKYEGLNLEDLSNFKSENTVQQWDGEDFRTGQRKSLNLNMLSLSKRERKLNYSVDSYFKETMRAGPSKTEKGPKVPRAPKQIQMYARQFCEQLLLTDDALVFADRISSSSLLVLQNSRSKSWPLIRYRRLVLRCHFSRSQSLWQRLNDIPATAREAGPDDTPESLEAERQAAQEFIDNGDCLASTITMQLLLNTLRSRISDGRRAGGEVAVDPGGFRRLEPARLPAVRSRVGNSWMVSAKATPCVAPHLTVPCRTNDFELLASEIQDKTADDVAIYYPVFKKKWKELSGEPIS